MPELLNLPDNPAYCPSCNTKFEGSFCSNCGEKKPFKKDYSVSKYATQAVDMFTHFDGKFFNSFKYLLFYPGKLTEENLAGRKVKLAKPVQLYVVINLIYFFLMKKVDVFLTYLNIRVKMNPALLQDIQVKANELGLTTAEYIERFDALLPTTSKTFIFILIPFIATGVWLFHFKRIREFVPHLIFATHFFTFFLAFTLIYFELILRWLNPETLTFEQRMIGVLAGLFVIMVYLFFALKRIYKQSLFLTGLKTILLTGWVLVMIGLYNDATNRLNYLWL